MADEQARKILDGRWAYTSTDRVNPEDATPALTRAAGFPTPFETTETPERGVMNQLLCEVFAAAYDQLREGVLPYDADIDYPEGAVVKWGTPPQLRHALSANGPSSTVASPSNVAVWGDVAGETAIPGATGTPGAQVDNGSIHWSWTPGRDNGSVITGYILQLRLQNGNWGAEINVGACCHRVTGLTNGETYEARVRAVNAEGNGPWSVTGTGSPVASRPEGGAQLGLVVEAGDSQIELIWLQPENNGSAITTYRYQWRTGSNPFSSSNEGTTATLGATISSLANGTEYDFRVRAENAAGNGDWSNVATATPAVQVDPVTAPDAPGVGLTSQNAALRVVITNDDDNGARITSWDIQYKLSSSASWTTAVSNHTSPFYLLSSLANGSAYDVRARARNSAGASSYSSVSTGTPSAAVPDAPNPLRVRNTTGGVVAEWGIPDNNGAGITTYRLHRSTSSTFSSSVVALNGSATSQTITGLTEGTRYYFRVRATNSVGNSTWSGTVNLVVDDLQSVPDAPSNLQGTARVPRIVDWKWDTPDDNGPRITGYQLQWRYSGGAGWSGNIVSTSAGCALIVITDTASNIEARVRAINSVGTGSWSSTVTVDPGEAGVYFYIPNSGKTIIEATAASANASVSDGTTLWFSSGASAVAYNVATQANDASKSFNLSGGAPTGAASDGTTLWFILGTNARAYVAATQARDTPKDISLGAGDWEAAACDGTTLWFVDRTTDTARAYVAATRIRDASKDISLGGGTWNGATYGDGALWFTRHSQHILAYDAVTLVRDSSRDISLTYNNEGSLVYSDSTFWGAKGHNQQAHSRAAFLD